MEHIFRFPRCWNMLWNKTLPFGVSLSALITHLVLMLFGHIQQGGCSNAEVCLPSCTELYLDVFWTHALSAWPLPEAQSPGPVSWHVSLPPPAKEECRCPWGKWKHLVLARPVHVSAGPHELAGDACTEENRRPQRWPTSFLPHRPCRPQPRNTDENVLGSRHTAVKLTKTDLHPGEIQPVSFAF